MADEEETGGPKEWSVLWKLIIAAAFFAVLVAIFYGLFKKFGLK
jgi:hypothetical protein